MATRRDLLLEISALTDSSGNYTGDWIETCDVFDIRVIANESGSGSSLYVEEANAADGLGSPADSVIYVHVVSPSGGQVRSDALGLTARFFRVRLDSFAVSQPVEIAVRAISGGFTHGLV